MKKCLFVALLCVVNSLAAQTYVWKNGHPLVVDPDSITFVKPDFSAQVTDSVTKDLYKSVNFIYLTQDYSGNPLWASAQLILTLDQAKNKYVGKMALYNHYTISSSDDCPTCGKLDIQAGVIGSGYAVVSADYEGFGETADRPQAYCYGEANARVSIDALLAAREWLVNEGYTLTDTIVNFGYSQGGQTTVAVLKLSQTEYRGKVHFMKTIAGAGPYDLILTYKQFLKWKRVGQAAVLPLMFTTINELEHLGLDYKEVFKGKLASNVKSWIISKKFDTNELQDLIGQDSIKNYMQPAYIDSTNESTLKLLELVDKYDFTNEWIPDPETDIVIVHSPQDDVVATQNSVELYNFLKDKGVANATLDTNTLKGTHLQAGMLFVLYVPDILNKWEKGQK